jgi:hypothetical protein
MKIREIEKLIREQTGPFFKKEGFKRKGGAGYIKQIDSATVEYCLPTY